MVSNFKPFDCTNTHEQRVSIMSLARSCALGGYQKQKVPNGLFYDTGVVIPQDSPPMNILFDNSNPPSQDTDTPIQYVQGPTFFNCAEVSGTTYTKSYSVTASGLSLHLVGRYAVFSSTQGQAPWKLWRSPSLQASDIYYSCDSASASGNQTFKKNGLDPYTGTGALNTIYSISNYGSGLQTYGEWITFLMPKKMRLQSIKQVTRASFTNRGAKVCTVLYSDDSGATYSLYGTLVFANSTESSQTITASQTDTIRATELWQIRQTAALF